MPMKPKVRASWMASALMVTLTVSSPAAAYIGPGAGLSAIGTIAALVGAVLLLLVSFVWYPLKRLLRKRSASPNRAQGTASPAAEKKG